MKISGKCQSFFGKGRTIHIACAPGRLDVMGGIADYSGSLVLQTPIPQQTTAALAFRGDDIVRVHSELARASDLVPIVETRLSYYKEGKGDFYQRARNILAELPGGDWAAYVIGCFLVLMREKGVDLPGADIWIDSRVPIGKGVSSSAAIEVATMTALASAAGLKLSATELPILAQIVENRVAGAPCGLMDQLASYLGEERRLLPILCQPDRIYPLLDIPNGIHFVGVDSGVRHAVSGASYGDVRAAAFMGYSIIARLEGTPKKALLAARKTGATGDLPYGGYLANIPPSTFEAKYRALLPENIEGEEFLQHFGATIDPITTPQPGREYAVRQCAAHPIWENHRVQSFELILRALNAASFSPKQRWEYLQNLGELMRQSHVSYSQCGLGCAATDAIVDAAQLAGPPQGVYGAKITGGGSGGTVCVLCEGKKGLAAINEIARRCALVQGIEPLVFSGGSDGARKNGVKTIRF